MIEKNVNHDILRVYFGTNQEDLLLIKTLLEINNYYQSNVFFLDVNDNDY